MTSSAHDAAVEINVAASALPRMANPSPRAVFLDDVYDARVSPKSWVSFLRAHLEREFERDVVEHRLSPVT